MPERNKFGQYTFLLVFLLAIFSIGSMVERQQPVPLLVAFVCAFASYALLIKGVQSLRILFIIGVVARLVLFVSLPSLSDDVFRFIWDGTLLQQGIDPFERLPNYYLGRGIEGISKSLYERLNSPNYFTIYPPTNQLVFWLSVQIGSSWLASTNVMRALLLLADLGSFFLLRKLLKQNNRPARCAYWFFLNPLIILEFTGNVHFEGLVIFFLLLGIFAFESNRLWLSSLGFGLAAGTKLLPLIYFPLLFLQGLRQSSSKKWLIALAGGVVALLSLMPMFSAAFISGMQSSLDLYFRSFEFNASIYFLMREFGFMLLGYNNIATIGPLLSLASLLGIVFISFWAWRKNWALPKAMLFVLTCYLLLATTIHPWYITPLIVLGLLSGYWWPMVWSFAIVITYLGYTSSGYHLPMAWVAIEYAVVFLFAWSERRYRAAFANDS